MPVEVLVKIREQYPQYKDLPDRDLARLVLQKYPQYQDLLGDVAEAPQRAGLVDQWKKAFGFDKSFVNRGVLGAVDLLGTTANIPFRAVGGTVESIARQIPGVNRYAPQIGQVAEVASAAAFPAAQARLVGAPARLASITQQAGAFAVRPGQTVTRPSRFTPPQTLVPEAPKPSPTAPFKAEKFGESAPIIRATRSALGEAETVQRRGVLSDKVVDEFAQLVGIRPDELARLQPGTTLSAEHVASARGILKQSADRVYRLAEEYVRAPSTDAAVILQQAYQQHASYQLGLSGVATESGRALRQFSRMVREGLPIPIAEGVKPQNIQSLAQSIVQAGRGGAASALGRLAQPTWRDMLVEYATAAKLTGPVTHERNFLGNMFGAAMRPLGRVGTAIAETGRAVATGAPRERFLGEAAADVAGMGSALTEASQNFLRALRTEGAVQAVKAADTGIRPAGAIPGKIGRVVRLPFRLLDAADQFWRTILEKGDLYAQAYRQAAQEGGDIGARTAELLKSPTAQMTERAQASATHFLYQDALTGFSRDIMNARGKSTIARVLFPFVKTPYNIMRVVLEHTPVGLTGVRTGQGAEASEKIGRALAGSGVAATFAALAAAGYISGQGPDNPRQKAVLRASGWQPNSIRLGDRWVSYRGFEPMGSFLSMAANMVEATRSEKDLDAIAGRMARDAGRFIMDSTYLTGLSQIIDAITEPATAATRLVKGTVTGFIPRILSPIQQAIDPTLREGRTLPQAVQRSLPGVSRGAPSLLNPLGEPIQGVGGPARGLLPPQSAQKHDPLLDELARLGLGVPQPARVVRRGGKRLEVDEGERRRMVQARGAQIRSILEPVITAPGWDRIDDDQKRAILQSLMQRAARTVHPDESLLKAR